MAVAIELRKMKKEDVPRVMEIERECFPTPWQESAYYTEIANHSAYYIVACKEDEIVGYAGMWVIMDEAHITTLGVAREFRGTKVGEQLLVGLLDESIRRNARRATLEVRQSNHIAQNLYKKYGFVPAAVRRGYYTDNHENAIVMWIYDIKSNSFKSEYAKLKQKLQEACSNASKVEGVA